MPERLLRPALQKLPLTGCQKAIRSSEECPVEVSLYRIETLGAESCSFAQGRGGADMNSKMRRPDIAHRLQYGHDCLGAGRSPGIVLQECCPQITQIDADFFRVIRRESLDVPWQGQSRLLESVLPLRLVLR